MSLTVSTSFLTSPALDKEFRTGKINELAKATNEIHYHKYFKLEL